MEQTEGRKSKLKLAPKSGTIDSQRARIDLAIACSLELMMADKGKDNKGKDNIRIWSHSEVSESETYVDAKT